MPVKIGVEGSQTLLYGAPEISRRCIGKQTLRQHDEGLAAPLNCSFVRR